MTDPKRSLQFTGAEAPRRSTISPDYSNRVSQECVRDDIGEDVLATLTGIGIGSVVHTTHKATPGDGLGRRWKWNPSAVANNVNSIGINPMGRWEAINDPTLTGGTVLAGLQVTELASTPGSGDGEVKACNGYATAGDGGGGLFSWTAGASGGDGYIRIDATGGQWQRNIDDGVFNAAWYGAVPGDTGAQQTAINLAITAAYNARVVSASGRARVKLCGTSALGGVFRTTAKIAMKDYVTLEFVDAQIHATSDCGIESLYTKYGRIINADIYMDANVDGIRATINGDYVRDIQIINPTFSFASGSSTSIGVNMTQVGTGTGGSDVHYFPHIETPTCTVRSGQALFSYGVKAVGATGTFSRCVGGRVNGGTFENIGYGVFVDNCDTFVVDKSRFTGIGSHTVTVTPGSNTGNGTCTAATYKGYAKAGAWTLTCNTAVANGGVFTLTKPGGSVVSTTLTMTPGAGAATVLSAGGLTFTLTDGSANFIVGDTFTLAVPTHAAVTFGANTNQCAVLNPRIEANARDLRLVANCVYPELQALNEFNLNDATICDEGAVNPSLWHNGGEVFSRNSHTIRWDRQQNFTRPIWLGYFETSNVNNGINYSIADASGELAPTIVVTLPTGAFSFPSIKLNSWVDPNNLANGVEVQVYNRTSQTMTIRDESTLSAPELAASIPLERIRTLTGADVAVAGPGFSRFWYFYDRATPANSRWIHKG